MANDLRTLIEEALTDVATDVVDLDGRTAALRGDVDRITGSGGAPINDGAAGSASTYSSSKIETILRDAVAAAVAGLVNGAPGALDQLNEFAAALGNDAEFGPKVLDALSKRVRFDAAQALTSAQQTQVRDNISAVSRAEVGDTTTSLAAVYAAAKQ